MWNSIPAAARASTSSRQLPKCLARLWSQCYLLIVNISFTCSITMRLSINVQQWVNSIPEEEEEEKEEDCVCSWSIQFSVDKSFFCTDWMTIRAVIIDRTHSFETSKATEHQYCFALLLVATLWKNAMHYKHSLLDPPLVHWGDKRFL